MYKYMLNAVVRISIMFAKYYTIILGGGMFFRGHDVHVCQVQDRRFRLLIATKALELVLSVQALERPLPVEL